MTPQELQQHVETIVVVMMENRSFDHVLGYLHLPDLWQSTGRGWDRGSTGPSVSQPKIPTVRGLLHFGRMTDH